MKKPLRRQVQRVRELPLLPLPAGTHADTDTGEIPEEIGPKGLAWGGGNCRQY